MLELLGTEDQIDELHIQVQDSIVSCPMFKTLFDQHIRSEQSKGLDFDPDLNDDVSMSVYNTFFNDVLIRQFRY